ncbi:class I SAM-dependent methyltransferase [Elioraea sp.]|uniref:class I SAM-dependent methyltransferase n=1 Tax=Elioraea sp. TaxID=2185103 RepID=UPI0025BCE77A|nr:class I SAM-dependent methyltransferase [Elioraea sp.]
MQHTVTEAFHDDTYRRLGFAAQRRYPNEELVRFLARHFFPIPRTERASVPILEVGCGSGANLWMIAREGFAAHGLDLSAEGLVLCREMLASWGVAASLHHGDMAALPFADASMAAVVDVFSAYCLDEAGAARFLDEVARVLRPGGRFFTYTPSKLSEAFTNHAPATLSDASTLSGIARETSPFAGNTYPFRFTTNDELAAALAARGLAVTSSERVARTYRDGEELFWFAVIAAEKR